MDILICLGEKRLHAHRLKIGRSHDLTGNLDLTFSCNGDQDTSAQGLDIFFGLGHVQDSSGGPILGLFNCKPN